MASGSQNMTTYLAKGLQKVLTTSATNTDNLLYINTADTNITADILGTSNSIAFTRMNTTGAYTTGHIVWLNAANIGTPFQLVIHDSSDLYFYKRYKSSGTWSAWTKMKAGTADTWTTARTLTVGGTGKSVDGSENVSWSMDDIMGTSTNAYFYRGDKTWSQTLNAMLTVNGIAVPEAATSNWVYGIKWYNSNHTLTYFPHIAHHSTGGTGSKGSISIIPFATNTTPWGGTEGLFITSDALKFNNVEVVRNSGSWDISVTGNAATANKWKTKRTLTIGGTGKDVDGSGNVSWTKAEILGSSDTTKFYRGDQSWSNTLTGNLTLTNGGIFRIDHTGQGAKTKGTAYSAFYITFKNSTNDKAYVVTPIRYVGTDGTDQYNTCVILGSDNGTTWIGAGESSNYLPGKIAYNDENLYLSADGSVKIYTSCANDGSSYSGPVTISGTTITGNLTGNVTGNCSGSSGSCTGNAATATEGKYLMNRGGNTVTIADSSWAIQITPSGHTNRATVFSQNWKQSGLTYTPSGGSATAVSDTADFKLWLSSSNTSNALQLNMQLDGRLYALGGFQGTLTGNCSGSAGSLSGGLVTNTVTSHGNLAVTTAKGSYYGINFGHNASGMSIMSINASHQGLYNQTNGQWILYYNAASNSKSIVLGNSTVNVTGGISLNLNTKVTGTLTVTSTITGNLTGNVTGNCSGSSGSCTGNAATATTADQIKGSYTSNGGQQNPNYFGTNKVGFLMMNTKVNNNTHYKDWIIMDCYSGNDVGGGVAFGVNRQALGAYIMRSAAARTSWAESAELIGTHNYTSYTVKKDGTGASGSWGISVTGSSASCTGNAVTCSRPAGFTSNGTGAAWGNTTGTSIAWWDVGNCAIDFRRDNPSTGKLSVKVDGRFYGNEGTYPTMLMNYTNNYWGMGDPDAGSGVWIRTTTAGIIPYQSGGAGSGHCGLGTSTWYFSYVYADNFYGKLNGSCTGSSSSCTGNAATASACYGPVYLNGMGTNTIYNGGTDGASGVGGALNNLVFSSWFGVSFTTSCASQTYTGKNAFSINCRNGYAYCGRMYNAVWNDYAEYRECDLLPPGTCVQENDNGHLTVSDKRLLAGVSIISDTYGFAEGETETAQTPIAVSGRVLAYTYLPREMYHAGMAVCSAPGGTVDIMTREEIRDYPDAIVGIVSEIPNYEVWGTGEVEVNGRIWIKVR